MTSEEALKHFKNVRDSTMVILDSGFGTKPNENNIVYRNRKLYAELAISALEKQIPKKPDTKITNRGIDITGEYDIDSDYLCPVCECIVGDCEREDYWYKYCPDCGQALDWRGDEV